MPIYKPIDRQRMITEYLDAFKLANPDTKPPVVSFVRNMFRFKKERGAPWEYRAYRHRDLKKMTEALLERAGVSLRQGERA